MGVYTKLGMRVFGELAEKITPFFRDLIEDLRRAGFELSLQEYLSMALLTAFIVFLVEIPTLTFIISVLTRTFLFSLLSAFLLSLGFATFIFFLFLGYPKAIIKDKAKEIDRTLPIATLHLFTIAQTKLPLDKVFKIFEKFVAGGIRREIGRIVTDVDVFGIDINTALERAVARSPSKDFKELLWGILSTNRAGGDLGIYLKEKSSTFLEDFRRRLYEFSHQLTLYIEIYLVAIVIGAIFFTILTAIFAGLVGIEIDIILIQFFLISIFIPGISIFLIIFIKAASPGGE